jgi:hypothetical protein
MSFDLDDFCTWSTAGAIFFVLGVALAIRGLLMMAWAAKGGALTAAACLVGGPCL